MNSLVHDVPSVELAHLIHNLNDIVDHPSLNLVSIGTVSVVVVVLEPVRVLAW